VLALGAQQVGLHRLRGFDQRQQARGARTDRSIGEQSDGGRRPGLSDPRACGYADRQDLGGCDAKDDLDAEYRASRRGYGVWQVSGGITRPWDDSNGNGEACKSLR
jgi:hypothetical protein